MKKQKQVFAIGLTIYYPHIIIFISKKVKTSIFAFFYNIFIFKLVDTYIL